MTGARWVESMPEIYDRCLGPVLFEPYAHYLADRVRGFDPPPVDVLELAAGTGLLTAQLVAALPDARVTGTDLNPAMVDWGASRVPGARWRAADAMQLDWPERSFDLVACQFGAMFFPDKPAAYRETARVLRDTGRYLFAVWDVLDAMPAAAAFMDAVAAVLPNDTPTFLTRTPHGYADPDRIEADVRAGGMQLRALDRVTLRGRAPSAAAIAEGFCFGTPLRFELEERGELAALAAAIEGELAERLGSGPVDTDLGAFVGIAEPAESRSIL